jgi:hypothetical protein
MKKTLIYAALLLLIISSFSFAPLDVYGVEAAGTIYIRADGSIDPPIAGLSSGDNITYSMTDNRPWSIVIEKDNIVLDGALHVLQGSGS